MQNNPSRPTVYDIDAALEAIEADNRRQEEALRAFYARRAESAPVLVFKYPMLGVLVASWAFVLALGYAAYQLKLWLFPHM